jgi:S-methylmethionine-dependent homocysteine/selenocysteine methylase
MDPNFEETVRAGSLILTDGGIETRVMFETDIPLPEHIQVTALVNDPIGGPALRRIYGSYLAVARSFELPVIIGTPTFRAGLNFVWRARLGGAEAVQQLNADAVAMTREGRARSDHQPAFIAGVIGPSGDAYQPGESLPAGEAREYHSLQAGALARTGVDFLYAPTFPAVEEALGATVAMGCHRPSIRGQLRARRGPAGARRYTSSRRYRAHRRRGTASILLDWLCSPLRRGQGFA